MLILWLSKVLMNTFIDRFTMQTWVYIVSWNFFTSLVFLILKNFENNENMEKLKIICIIGTTFFSRFLINFWKFWKSCYNVRDVMDSALAAIYSAIYEPTTTWCNMKFICLTRHLWSWLHSQYWYFIWEWRFHSITAAMGFLLRDKITAGYPIKMKSHIFSLRMELPFRFI